MGLKVLCILSFIGFIGAVAVDVQNYFIFSKIEVIETTLDQDSLEELQDTMLTWEKADVDVSDQGIKRIGDLFLYRGIVDVLALLGVILMFVRLKLGYTIYVIFQLTYVALPFVMLGAVSLAVVEPSNIAVILIYVLLFTTQRKHLISREE